MKLYSVTWMIELDAADEQSAAMQARTIQLDPTNIATVFTVAETDGIRPISEPVQIDVWGLD